MQRESWINKILEATKFFESPERYWYWSALAAISAVIKDRVFLNRYAYILYPNIYVMLVSARSGLRKGVPIGFTKRLVERTGVSRSIVGQSSIQGIIKELAQQKTLQSGEVLQAQAIIIASELKASMTEDQSTWAVLTELHNTHEHTEGWKKILSGAPEQELKNLCLCFLGASNEALFEDTIRARDIEGGFIARTFIVHESKRRMINSLVDEPEGLVPIDELVAHLKEVAKLQGEFKWGPGSKNLYKKWYEELATIETDDRTGTIDRLGDQVLKAAMLISMAKGFDLVLYEEDIEEAIRVSERCVPGTQKMSHQGKSATSGVISKIMKLMIDAPGQEMTRQKLQQKVWPDADHIEFDRAIETLIGVGFLTDPFRNEERTISYRVKPEAYAQYTQFKFGG